MAETMKCQWCEQFRESGCKSGRQEMAVEVERLQAIVDKLPKTADGVPVVPGMEVWHTESESWHTVTALRPAKNEWLFDDFYDVWDNECYSTHEAAEAASGSSAGGEDKK